VLDAILLEQQGVPTVAIVTEVFHETGRAMAEAWGLPGFRFVEMPHPIANLDGEALDERADRLVEPVLELLTLGRERLDRPAGGQ
jgi:hypothetical protein